MIREIAYRFGKIIIEHTMGLVPPRNENGQLVSWFSEHHFNVEAELQSKLLMLDTVGKYTWQHTPTKQVHIAFGRFQGSVSDEDIATFFRTENILDTSVPERDMFEIIATLGAKQDLQTLCISPYCKNIFCFKNTTETYQVTLENKPQLHCLHWHMTHKGKLENNYHTSNEKFIFPIKESALPW